MEKLILVWYSILLILLRSLESPETLANIQQRGSMIPMRLPRGLPFLCQAPLLGFVS